MKWKLTVTIVLAASLATAVNARTRQSSAELLFGNSDSALALSASANELRRNARNVNAWFVHMESARLRLLVDEELKSALMVLSLAKGNDPRARLAAERVRELAANTPAFRSALPNLVELLQGNSPYRRELSIALLNAANEGVSIPTRARLTRRLRHWHIAGPFGNFSNVDFDRSWPPEHDQLRSIGYEGVRREAVDSESGELTFPDYFTHSGIYYATSDVVIPKTGHYRLTVESDGTFSLQVDGETLSTHDSRFLQQSFISRADTQLSTGKHYVLLKLRIAAQPVRVWLEDIKPFRTPVGKIGSKEVQYLDAAASLSEGIFDAAFSIPAKSSAIAEVLRGNALARSGLDDQAQNSYEAAVELDPNNLLAEFYVASNSYANQNFDTAVQHLAKILKTTPEFWPAQELKYEIAEHFDWPHEREQALTARLRFHPTCATYLDAAKLYSYYGNRERSSYYESKLATCSPTPYQYWEQLSFHGDHTRALASIGRYLVRRPNDRRALSMATREAVLVGDQRVAKRYGYALLIRAPNMPKAQKIARNPEEILDSRSAYSAPGEFYKPFVRDARPMMAAIPAQPPDSEVLINDRVVKLNAEGAWIYQHTVTQVFDKKGIEGTGELELPHNADLLELRTIKRNGAFVEPEISDNKESVSMPSLEEGDAVEMSYLQHVNPTSLVSTPELLDFVLGATDSPTRSARFTLMRDLTAPEPVLWQSPEVRKISTERSNGEEVTAWQAAGLSHLPQEPDAPTWERRARILFLALDPGQQTSAAARYRDELIEATRITPRIEQIATTLRSHESREQIAAAYQLVMATLLDESSDYRSGSVPTADQTFEQGEGSRAAALIALLAALGFDADLELAAEHSTRNPDDDCLAERCYVHPLVRVRLPDGAPQIFLDTTLNGLAAGAMSPDVAGEKALIVRRTAPSKLEIATVASSTDERSVAHARFELNRNGDLSGVIHIRFGSIRGAQMREALRQLSMKGRSEYLEEIAQRILPQTREASGSVSNEENPEKSLELDLKIEAPSFAQPNGSEQLDLGQIVPALGLSKLYATLPERRDDLLLGTPLIENSEFLIHLPPGIEVKQLPQSVSLKTAFGEYKTKFEFEPGTLTIVRSFRIPAQVVLPDKYPAFSNFALDIDRAERELIQLRRNAFSGGAPEPKPQASGVASN